MKTRIILVLAFVTLSVSSCARRVVVTPVATVNVVKTLPKTYKIVRVKGNRYYFWDGRHYKKTRRGYVIVNM